MKPPHCNFPCLTYSIVNTVALFILNIPLDKPLGIKPV